MKTRETLPPGQEENARSWRELAFEGYTIKAFLAAADVEALQRLRVATIPNIAGGFFTSALSVSEIRTAILEGFQAILKDRIKELAPGFRLVAASFVIKKAGTGNGRSGLHQDSSLVDHRTHLGINVWVPLCDVDDQNGCLRVAGRSHRFNRIGSLPPISGPHANFEKSLAPPSITSLQMKAGESCMFDTRLLHSSEENHSDSDRVAAFFSLIPEDHPTHLYFRNPEIPGQLDVFQVDNKFLLHFDPLEYPSAVQRATMVFVRSFEHVQRTLLAADFAALHSEPKPDSVSSSTLWTRFWRRFR